MKKYDGYALVTGGDEGIGYCIAEQLAMNGYNLVLVARDEPALEKARDHFSSKYKVNVLIYVKDLADRNDSKDVYEFTQSKGIHVALLVNNAGVGIWGLFEDSKYEDQINMIELLCRSVTALTNLFLPDMIKKGEGGIIFISSFVSRMHVPNFAAYAACKAFESSFGTTLNFEVQSKNIDVLMVCPSVTKTRFIQRKGFAEVIARGDAKFLGFKIHAPEKVAELAIKSLGRKIEVIHGNILDKFFFYSLAFTPLPIERVITRLYFKYIYELEY
jgi:short-subunit dehydrogenase